MRLIDVDALVQALHKADTVMGQPHFLCKTVYGCINKAPTIDVAPVRHGHWVKISPAGIYECSECGKNVMTSDIEAYEYCHGCGARMDGDGDE